MNRFTVLTLAHVVAARELCVVVATSSNYLQFAFTGLLLGQASLLAIWVGLGNASLVRRGAAICVAGSFLWAVLVTAADGWRRPDAEELCVLALAIIACLLPTIALFLALKRCGPRLIICSARKRPPANKPFQFSTQHLLMLAVVVAAALVAGRLGRAMDNSIGNGWFVVGVFCCILPVCFIYAVLAAVWACLPANKVIVRVPIALLVGALVGLVPPFYFRLPGLEEYLLCLMSAAIAQTVTILSLLVARSAGYRLVRRLPERTSPRADLTIAGVHPLD
jgi:hypothetical protein